MNTNLAKFTDSMFFFLSFNILFTLRLKVETPMMNMIAKFTDSMFFFLSFNILFTLSGWKLKHQWWTWLPMEQSLLHLWPITMIWTWNCSCALHLSSILRNSLLVNLNRVYEIGKKFRNEGVDLTNNLGSPPVIWFLQHAIFYKEQEGEIFSPFRISC